MEDITANHRIRKRTALKLLGAGVLVGTSGTVAADRQESQLPTISVSSPGCEELELWYKTGRVPLTVTAVGPSTFTEQLSPGERLTPSVDPGQYAVTAVPVGAEKSRGKGNPINIEGSPTTVLACETGEVLIEPFCNPDGTYRNLARATNTSTQPVIVTSRPYAGDELLADYGGVLLQPGDVERAGFILDPEFFETHYGQAPTRLEFLATVYQSDTEISVSPSRLDYPDDLPCEDTQNPPEEITGQINVRVECVQLGDIEGWYYRFFQQNDSNVPVTLTMDVYSGETLLSTGDSDVLHPDLEMSYGTFHESYFRDANVTQVTFSATSDTGDSVPVDPAQWNIPADLPSC